MDNVLAQTDLKAFSKRVTILSAIALVLSVTLSNAYAVPPENILSCVEAAYNYYECCWTETDPADPEQIEIYKCQDCWIINNALDCGDPRPPYSPPPSTGESIVPEIEGGIEQPPTENKPPIKSDNSVAPNEDSNAIDEQQSNSNPPLTDQRVPPGNVGVLEQLEDSSNDQNGESGDSVSSDNSGFSNVVPQEPQS